MYIPPKFNETRLAVLHEAIRQARLSILVTQGEGGLEASHIPIWLDPAEGERGTLYGHLARANPQGRRLGSREIGLVICPGPDAYVTPSWYPSKPETGRAVPTWNYVAVHAAGPVEVFTDPARLRGLLARLTDQHEAGRPQPWSLADAPPDYLEAQLAGIVGFRLEIARLDGKWKLSQNRSPTDRQGVIDGLNQDPLTATIAALMAERPS